MFKLFVVLFFIFYSFPTEAGFGTGLVVGAVVGSAASSPSATGNSLYASDKEGRDVIVCCTSRNSSFTMCEDLYISRGINRLTPAQFAGKAGYTHLYKRGFAKVATGCDMIVMEVGK